MKTLPYIVLYIKGHRVFNPLEGEVVIKNKNIDKDVNLSMKSLPYIVLYIKGHRLFWTINWEKLIL